MAPTIELRTTRTVQGAQWVGTGFHLFGRAPLTWMAIAIVYGLLTLVVSVAPGGSLLTALFSPVLGGGLMLGCAALAQGGTLKIEHLFAGFTSGQAGSLLVVGALVMIAGACVVMLCFTIAFGSQWHVLLSGQYSAMDAAALLFALLLGLLLMAPVLMASWFAPALVVLGGQDGASAMKLSFRASLRHFGAFLLYGLIMLVLAVLATIPLGLGWLIISPVFTASSYAAYCDLFELGPPPVPDA